MANGILLVEDDAALRSGLVELLGREGYDVAQAATAREARQRLTADIDLIVLDVTLPDGDGVSLCREWRAAGVRQGILFLTAKDEEFDVVRGLDAGGNDYVTKPFRMMELLSRVRALLRRGDEKAVHGGIAIDESRLQVTKDGQSVPLTLTEFRILSLLARRHGVVPRERLLEALWDDGGKYIDDNTLSVHVSRLREKIGAEHIRTIRGVGYQWQD